MTDFSQTPQSPELSLDAERLAPLSISQIVDEVALLLQGEEAPERKQYEALYGAFYRRKKQMEQEAGVDQEYILLQEARLNDLNQTYKALERKRSEALAALQLENGQKAEAVLGEIEQLLQSEEEFKAIYERYHQLREQWEALRPLTQQDDSRLGKRFVALREEFYELKHINAELRDYDYRKNLEAKQAILAELKALDTDEDIVAANQKVSTEIAYRWRDIGPVAPEERQSINASYKELTTNIFKRHQAYQEGLKAGEEEQASAKRGIIAQLQELADNLPTTHKAWGESLERIKALQEAWRGTAYAGRKLNNELVAQYRELCTRLHEAKLEYYKERKEAYSEAINQRRALIERANALADSTKFAETVTALTALQEEWKKLPHLRKAEGDQLWAEFRKPFEAFYQRKREHDRKQHHQEKRNEEGKRQLLEQLKGFVAQEGLPEQLKEKLTAIKEQWRKFGRASAAVNDALWEEFCQLNDSLYERLRQHQGERRQGQIKERHQRLSAEPNGVKNELQQLQRKAERLKTELRNYDNNMHFLSTSGKGESPFLKEIERKKARLAEDLARVEEELALLKQA